MKYIKILIIIFILTQLVTIGLLFYNKQNTTTDNIAFYDIKRNQYIIRNKNTGDIMIAILFNTDDTLLQCYVNNEVGTSISIDFFDNNEKSITVKDDDFSFFSTQYINPSGEIILERHETTAFFSRHSQFLKDGILQQRNWNHDTQDWEIEVPFRGKWVDYLPVMGGAR